MQEVMDFYMLYAEHIITVVLALCVFTAALGKVWNWPIGLVGVTMYGIHAYFVWGLYADGLLQIFYFATGVIGWIWWSLGGKDREPAPVIDSTWIEKILWLVTIGFVGFHWGEYLKTTTDSTVPYLDAYTTITCLIAQLLLMARNKFTWVLWLIADVAYVYLFHVKGLSLLSVEYALFSVNAAFGFYMWTKIYKEQKIVASYISGTK
ncbi:MAG: nicotinamide riboside transporter PnuC [Bacteroidales bacterium]